MGSGAEQRAAIDTFSAALPVMPDAEREWLLFGTVFIEYIDDLWPQSEPAAMPDWIRAHAFDILAALEQMLGRHPSVVAFRIGCTGSCGCSLISISRRCRSTGEIEDGAGSAEAP